jgi:hypothetical protein
MRAILENSPIIKSSVPEKLFQAGYSTHISPIIYHDKKLSGYKELFNIINNEVSGVKKQAGLDFPYSQC